MAGQLFVALVLPVLLLFGLTYLLSTCRLRFSSSALSLLAKQRELWMVGIIALVTAGAIKALFD